MADKKRLNTQVRKINFLKVMVIFLFIVLFLFLLFKTCGKTDLSEDEQVQTETSVDSLSNMVRTIVQNNVIFDSVKNDRMDGVVKKTVFKPHDLVDKKKVATVPDTNFTVPGIIDTVIDSSMVVDTITYDTILHVQDTSSLWVYPNPSGGLHRQAITVRFYSNRLCTIHYRMKGLDEWVEYQGGEIQIEKTGTLLFLATDTCGRKMETREEYYEIENVLQSFCPQDMGYVKVSEISFCIDTYEWPNRKGVKPTAYVSFYEAGDSCFSAGKRLCTSEEWMLACSGPYSYRYPYGDTYEEHACVTADTSVRVSGGKPECRSFFGMYDMSGNLLEWTDTRSVENSRFHYVTGGFWDSGVKSACSEKRYSYFTQNRHNPVGFRCCKDIIDK